MITTRSYGTWKSPITSEMVASAPTRLGEAKIDGRDVYWTETRPGEQGRSALVRYSVDGTKEDVLPAGFNVRTRVHEYGGGAFWVSDGTVYFVNFADQRVYVAPAGQEPTPITPDTNHRYADGLVDTARQRIICVREDHTGGGEPVNTLVSLPLDGGLHEGTILVEGNDFYAGSTLSPDGSRLAWLTWHHPNMPWDGTELWVADVDTAGELSNQQLVAGGMSESIFQPQWSPSGQLHFISDRTDWWNLYRWQDGQTIPLCPREAEFGVPQWAFHFSTYGFLPNGHIVCRYPENGQQVLAVLNPETATLTPLEWPYPVIQHLHVGEDFVILGAASATTFPGFYLLDLNSGACTTLYRTSEAKFDERYVSIPQPIEFPTENGLTAHAFYYAPYNEDYVAPAGAKPPLLVFSHGGPTSATSSALSPARQYWTSRGFAVVDVNYGGSTGYGRPYRQRLNGQWGVVDVEDCINSAKYLAEQGLADNERLAIRGGSAGGYTTLCALTFHDVFAAGASLFGVSDLEALAQETHKFESRYIDSMVGPYPERKDLYYDRSPIHFADQLNCPVIFLQGLEDRVVPPNQAERMFEALKAKGIPVAYLPFADEGHGFRKAHNVKRALEAEFYFYAQIFGFTPADPIEPVTIKNL